MYIAYCASEKKKLNYVLLYLTSKYFVIAKCDKFGELLQRCCRGYFVVSVTVLDFCRKKALAIKNNFSSSGLKIWVLCYADSPCSTTSFSPCTPRAAQCSNSEP